jgi:two-component system KDP operon response regulator KdpE
LYVDGDLVVDLTRSEVRLNDEPIILTPIEFRILAGLIGQVGHVVSQERLQMQVWGPRHEGAQDSLKQHIYNLRQKLEPDPEHPRRIVTRWGQGYLLQRLAVE